MQIGWIGLGTMGAPMAQRALDFGIEVRTIDLGNTRNKSSFSKSSFRVYRIDTHQEYISRLDALVLCLPDHHAALNVILTLGDLVPKLVVDFSTVSPRQTIDLAAKLNTHGSRLIDTPISGSKADAFQGSLTIFAGCKKGEVGIVDTLLNAVGSRIFYFEELGSGAAAKLVNQVMHLTNMMGIGLGIALSKALQIDFLRLLDPLNAASASSAMLSRFGSQIVTDSADVQFKASLALKDLKLADEYGLSNNIPAFKEVLAIYQHVVDNLGGAVNFSAVASIIGSLNERNGEDRQDSIRHIMPPVGSP